MNPSVVISGTSSGIGRQTACRLGARGWRVFAGVRSERDVERWKAETSAVDPLLLDVTDPRSVAAAAAHVHDALGGTPVDGLVNNAGITVPGPLEFVDLDGMRRQFEVNVFGVASLTRAFLPLLRRPGGRVVNVSSGAGKIAPPLVGPYTASKYALEAMSDVLRLELRAEGIAVSVIEPGFIESAMHAKNESAFDAALAALPPEGRARYGPILERQRANDRRHARGAAPASEVAVAIERALCARKPKTRYPVTREAKWLAWIGPFLGDRVRDAIFGRPLGL